MVSNSVGRWVGVGGRGICIVGVKEGGSFVADVVVNVVVADVVIEEDIPIASCYYSPIKLTNSQPLSTTIDSSLSAFNSRPTKFASPFIKPLYFS